MSDVQDLLEELAEGGEPRGASSVFDGAAVGAARHRRVRRRRRVVSVLGVVVAVVVAVAVIAQTSGSNNVHTRIGVNGGVTTTTFVNTPPATIASATAAQLASGHWSTIPAAPLSVRLFVSVAWTGKELIVWGGNDSPSGKANNDGAAYNPSTHTWRKLPPSPLTPRGAAAAVWTGSEVVFWGGVVPVPAGRVTPGSEATVAYRPDTNTWTTLAPAPLPPTTFPNGFWTGDRVMFFSGLDAASYNPSTNRWQRLPRPALPEHAPGAKVQRGWVLAAPAGPGRILAWSGWGAQKSLGGGEYESSAGSDVFRYDESTNRWTALGPAPGAISGPGEAFWTGRRLVVIGTVARPPLSQGPPEPVTAASYDPVTGKETMLPAGAFDAVGSSVWTGAALWTYAGYGLDAKSAVFDPVRETSRPLVDAPFTSNYPATPVWTGRSVLIYASAQLQPRQVHAIGGLEYSVG